MKTQIYKACLYFNSVLTESASRSRYTIMPIALVGLMAHLYMELFGRMSLRWIMKIFGFEL